MCLLCVDDENSVESWDKINKKLGVFINELYAEQAFTDNKKCFLNVLYNSYNKMKPCRKLWRNCRQDFKCFTIFRKWLNLTKKDRKLRDLQFNQKKFSKLKKRIMSVYEDFKNVYNKSNVSLKISDFEESFYKIPKIKNVLTKEQLESNRWDIKMDRTPYYKNFTDPLDLIDKEIFCVNDRIKLTLKQDLIKQDVNYDSLKPIYDCFKTVLGNDECYLIYQNFMKSKVANGNKFSYLVEKEKFTEWVKSGNYPKRYYKLIHSIRVIKGVEHGDLNLALNRIKVSKEFLPLIKKGVDENLLKNSNIDFEIKLLNRSTGVSLPRLMLIEFMIKGVDLELIINRLVEIMQKNIDDKIELYKGVFLPNVTIHPITINRDDVLEELKSKLSNAMVTCKICFKDLNSVENMENFRQLKSNKPLNLNEDFWLKYSTENSAKFNDDCIFYKSKLPLREQAEELLKERELLNEQYINDNTDIKNVIQSKQDTKQADLPIEPTKLSRKERRRRNREASRMNIHEEMEGYSYNEEYDVYCSDY